MAVFERPLKVLRQTKKAFFRSTAVKKQKPWKSKQDKWRSYWIFLLQICRFSLLKTRTIKHIIHAALSLLVLLANVCCCNGATSASDVACCESQIFFLVYDFVEQFLWNKWATIMDAKTLVYEWRVQNVVFHLVNMPPNFCPPTLTGTDSMCSRITSLNSSELTWSI